MSLELLDRAIALAEEVHARQLDKAGAPYIGHVKRVMQRVLDCTHGQLPLAAVVAVLHDTVEDGPAGTRERLRSAFPPAVCDAITILTHEDVDDSVPAYMRYVKRVKPNQLARIVKCADLRDNLDLSRIPSPTEEDFARCRKYARALAYLLLEDEVARWLEE